MTSQTTPTSIPNAIPNFLGQLALAPRQAHKALSVWPLVLRDEVEIGPPGYSALGAALAADSVTIGEVSDGGSVPHVRVSNRSAQGVLFMFGEELRGAKQNRISNASFLVPGESELVIDVSCVEQGRWSSRPRAKFAAANEVGSAALRQKMSRRVTMARAVGQSFDADQGEVWSEVESRLTHSLADSRTSAYSDYRDTRTHDVAEILEAFRPLERQVGFVACLGDDVAGAELIGHPSVFHHNLRALLRSYAIDAVDAPLVERLADRPRAQRTRFDSPESFLQALGRAEFASSPSLGEGTDLRLDGTTLNACALVSDELVHLTAFPE